MSEIYRTGVSPQTRAIHSSRNVLLAASSQSNNGSDYKKIGVVSSFNPQDNRDVEQVRGIGFGDQIAELVPQMSQAITISLNRTALYQMNIFQVLGYKGGVDGLVRALKHHRWPFDLKQEIVLSDATFINGRGLASKPGGPSATNGAGPEATGLAESEIVIATLYAGCWMTSYSATYSADTAIISEDVNLSVTDIFAYSANGLQKSITTSDANPSSIKNASEVLK